MDRSVAFALALALSVFAGACDDEPDYEVLAYGEEACEPLLLSGESWDDYEAECVTWACPNGDSLDCSAAIPYDATCTAFQTSSGCELDEIVRVPCYECPAGDSPLDP